MRRSNASSGGLDEGRLAVPRPLVDRLDVQAARALADHDELRDAEAHGEQADAVVLLARELAELAHLAEHRDRARARAA